MSHDYLYHDMATDLNPKDSSFDKRRVFSTEGGWRVRAAVPVGDRVIYSPSAWITVRGRQPEATADALEICRERLWRWMALPCNLPVEQDIALFTKHLPTVDGTPAGVSLRQAIMVSEIGRAATPEARQAAVARMKAFRETCTPLQKEYTDLLLGVAYVHAKDYKAARLLLGEIAEMSQIRNYINLKSHPKYDD